MTQAPQPAPNRNEDGSIDPSVARPSPPPAPHFPDTSRINIEAVLAVLENEGSRFQSLGYDGAAEAMKDAMSLIRELRDVKRVRDQMSVNCDFLLEHMDIVHDALCPDQNGTWQDRVRQAAEAATASVAVSPSGVLRSISQVQEQWGDLADDMALSMRRTLAAYDRCVQPAGLLKRFERAFRRHEDLIAVVADVLKKMDQMGGVEESRKQIADVGTAVLADFELLINMMNKIDPSPKDDSDDK